MASSSLFEEAARWLEFYTGSPAGRFLAVTGGDLLHVRYYLSRRLTRGSPLPCFRCETMGAIDQPSLPEPNGSD
jgi:hypothetical protein